MKKILLNVFALCAYLLLMSYGLTAGSLPVHPGGACYAIRLENISDEEFQRILNSPEAIYVLAQVTVGQEPGKELARITELGKKGKKVILQFWWGPSGRYNWSYHSLPGLAYDKEVQEDFFAGVDKTLKTIGAKNIYGVNLLEECGWFGIDILKPGDWRKNKKGIVSGYEDGDMYDFKKRTKCRWSINSPNITRHSRQFREMTGLDFRSAPIWDEEEFYVFERWCRQSSAWGEIAFFKHIRGDYPDIKCFTWHNIRASGNPLHNSDTRLMEKYIDGAIFDPYSSTWHNYFYAFGPGITLYPDKEIVGLMWGGFDSANYRRERMVLTYLSGCSAMGFFEGSPRDAFSRGDRALKNLYPGSQNIMDYGIPEIWRINCDIFKKLHSLPLFRRENSQILLIGYGETDPSVAINAYQGFKSVDIVPPGNEYRIDLGKYSLVIAHRISFSDYDYWKKKYKIGGPGLDYKNIEKYVKNGGILLLSGCRLLNDKRLFVSKFLHSSSTKNVSFDYKPQKDLKRKLGLDDSYHLQGAKMAVSVVDKNKVKGDDFGYLIPYGKGFVYYTPFYINRNINSKDVQNYKDLLRAVCSGLLKQAGKKSIAEKYICPKGYKYFEVANREGDIKCYIWQSGKEFKIPGKEFLTGDKNPVFGPKRRAGIIVKSK